MVGVRRCHNSSLEFPKEGRVLEEASGSIRRSGFGQSGESFRVRGMDSITGTERRMDTLNKDMVQYALLHFNKNLTLDHLDHHTESLYPDRRG
jgi:hypothetical protein